ncbi:MAG: DMT family transporter [Chromatiales bacterium]|jgi:drug/metabolite transporter (DMT)-like permease
MYTGLPLSRLDSSVLYRQSVVLGAVLITASELLFATMGAAVKMASATLPNEMLVFMRNALGLAVVVPIVIHGGGLSLLATRVPALHLLRAAAGVSAMYCFFYAIGRLQLADGMLLKMTAPIFMPIIGWLWLRERIGWLAVAAIPVGFVGVVIVLDPGGELSGAALIGLLGGVLAALAKVTVRRLTRTEPATRIVFYFAILALLISTLPAVWSWQMPTPREWGLLALIGAAGTAGQFLLTRGYAAAPAARVSPFTYFSVVFAAMYGYLLWDDRLTLHFVGGALLIAGAGIMALKSRPALAREADLPAS